MWKKYLEVVTLNMKIIRLTTGDLQTNTYLVFEKNEAVVIDPGDDAIKIKNMLKNNGLTCKHVLLTHSHFDHCSSARELQKLGALVYIFNEEAALLKNGGCLDYLFNKELNLTPDVLLRDKQKLSLCEITFEVLHTPGHTAGSCCFIANDYIFTGDTLFRLGRGRTDFPTGSCDDLTKSLQRIYALNGDFTIFPGHGESTILSYERRNNLA